MNLKYLIFSIFFFCQLSKSTQLGTSSKDEPTLDTIRKRLEYARTVKITKPAFIDPVPKIVGGFEVNITNYPYHAAYGQTCAAAIIGKKWAISAAHCGFKQYIRVGSSYRNRGKKLEVKKFFDHPGWKKIPKAHEIDYDFGLIELKETLSFSLNTNSIKLAREEDMVVGKMLTVIGWGNEVEGGNMSDVLRAVRVPLISQKVCQKIPFQYFNGTLTPRMFCAGYKEGKKDACQGDSGGPAVADNRLFGIISFGYGCATPDFYGVYSKVSEVRDWIKNITGLVLD